MLSRPRTGLALRHFGLLCSGLLTICKSCQANYRCPHHSQEMLAGGGVPRRTKKETTYDFQNLSTPSSNSIISCQHTQPDPCQTIQQLPPQSTVAALTFIYPGVGPQGVSASKLTYTLTRRSCRMRRPGSRAAAAARAGRRLPCRQRSGGNARPSPLGSRTRSSPSSGRWPRAAAASLARPR